MCNSARGAWCIDFRERQRKSVYSFFRENSRYPECKREDTAERRREEGRGGRREKPNSEQIPLDERIHMDDEPLHIHTNKTQTKREKERVRDMHIYMARKRRGEGRSVTGALARGTNVGGEW